jgi:3-deoxy-manno-octulosonate cytidylyltransferase (CMP-KDO synthetase)
VVIPARFASTRLPGKPLVEIAGRPMIVHVVERALQSGALDVVVATDDTRVAKAVAAAGHQVALTRTDHPSGSDRVMEVVQQRGWPDDDLVINVQGDEPLIPPALIAQTAGLLEGAADAAVATLCEPLRSRRLLFDPNVVKVIAGQHGLALYFSRAPIPYARDEFSQRPPEDDALPTRPVWFRHIGIYGFRVGALARFVALPPSPLEQTEALEQLRMLDNGMAIRVAEALQAAPGGVDTPEDLARVREIIGATSG